MGELWVRVVLWGLSECRGQGAGGLGGVQTWPRGGALLLLCATLSPTWAPGGVTARVAGSGRFPGGHFGVPAVFAVWEFELLRAPKEGPRKNIEPFFGILHKRVGRL